MNEHEIERILGQDFSAGTETFRDTLLERCLELLARQEDGIELDDGDIEMLAAAGVPFDDSHGLNRPKPID